MTAQLIMKTTAPNYNESREIKMKQENVEVLVAPLWLPSMYIMYNRLRTRQRGLIGELTFSEDMSFTDLARHQFGYLQWHKTHRIIWGLDFAECGHAVKGDHENYKLKT